MILTYLIILYIFFKFLLGTANFFKFKNFLAFDILSAIFLFLDIFFMAFSIFSYRFIAAQPFYVMANNINKFHIYNILGIVIAFILLILYKGIDDNLKQLHKNLVSIYFISTTIGYFLLF